MDAIFGALGLPLWIVLAFAATVAAYLYFGKHGAQIAAAAAALFIAVFAIRRDAKQDATQDRLEEDLKNERIRNEAADRADAAADRVRVDNATGGLRDNDGFRRD